MFVQLFAALCIERIPFWFCCINCRCLFRFRHLCAHFSEREFLSKYHVIRIKMWYRNHSNHFDTCYTCNLKIGVCRYNLTNCHQNSHLAKWYNFLPPFVYASSWKNTIREMQSTLMTCLLQTNRPNGIIYLQIKLKITHDNEWHCFVCTHD